MPDVLSRFRPALVRSPESLPSEPDQPRSPPIPPDKTRPTPFSPDSPDKTRQIPTNPAPRNPHLDIPTHSGYHSLSEARIGFFVPLYGVSHGSLRRAAEKALGLRYPEAHFTNMPLNTNLKQEVIKNYATKDGDTGSADVQIAVLHARIQQITEHLKSNPKDFHSRRGLMMLVGKRRRLEGYLRNRDIVKYRELIQRLGIREVKPR